MEKRELEVGDVVQIDPDKQQSDNGFFAGCFMLVTEPKSWGAQGFIAIPGERGKLCGEAYMRATWDRMEYIGKAAWIPLEKS